MSVVVEFSCPRCGYWCDSASEIATPEAPEHLPEAGDLTLCLLCGAPLELAEGAPPRWLTFEEVEALTGPLRAKVAMVVVGIVTQRPSRVVALARPDRSPAARP